MTRRLPPPLLTPPRRSAGIPRSAGILPAFLVRWLGLLALALVAAPAAAAPDYALSGQAPALEKSVLAQTPSGPVTALDVLMLDDMRDHAVGNIPIKAWINPGTLESAPFRPAMKTAVERLLAYQAMAAKTGDWQPAPDVLRVKTFGAALAAWIELAVKPQVKVVEETDPQSGRTVGDVDRYYLAHPEKYLRRQRAQVRYIFMAADITGTSGTAAKTAVRELLEGVVRDIQNAKYSFDEAARKASQAPSSVQGGLLPPFYNGTFFPEFDRQTFLLDRPGKTSPVFEGPEGYYAIQLVQTWPEQNIPIAQVREDIRQTLRTDFVRHYYGYLLARLAEDRYIVNMAGFWNYLNLEAPVIQIDRLRLTRVDYFRYFGNPIGSAYETQMYDVGMATNYWIEGEIVTAELARLGQTGHPWIQRAGVLAALPLKADRYYAATVPVELYAPSQALQTVRNNKQFIQGLRSARVIEFQFKAKDKKSAGGGAAGAGESDASLTINTINAKMINGVIPTEPNPIKLTDWLQKNAATPTQIPAAIQKLQDDIDANPFPNIAIQVRDRDWIDTIPGTPWYEVLKSVGVGGVSPAAKIGGSVFQYLVAAERPVDLTEWEAKPVMLRALAFQIEAFKLFAGEVLRLRQGGGVTYTFQ